MDKFILDTVDRRGRSHLVTMGGSVETLRTQGIIEAGKLCNGFRNVLSATVFDMNDRQIGSVK